MTGLIKNCKTIADKSFSQHVDYIIINNHFIHYPLFKVFLAEYKKKQQKKQQQQQQQGENEREIFIYQNNKCRNLVSYSF